MPYVVHFYHSFSSIVWSYHKIWPVPIIRQSWNDGMKVSMRTSSVFHLAFIDLKSNIFMCLFACAYISVLFIKEHHIAAQVVWPVACVCVSVYICVSVLDFFKTSLFATLCGGQLNLLCAVEVCRTPQWNWNWWLLFCLFFSIPKKLLCWT